MFLLCLRTKTYLSPQLLVYLPLKVPLHGPTCSFSYFYSVRLTAKIYPSTFLLLYMSTDISVHQHTCSVYFSFFGIKFSYLSAYLLGYVHTDLPENKFTCLPSYFSFVYQKIPTCHRNYLCTYPQMHPFITLPVHFHTLIQINR